MDTLQYILSFAGIILSGMVFIFGMFYWMVGRMDKVASVVKSEFVANNTQTTTILTKLTEAFQSHSLEDATHFGNIQTQIALIQKPTRRTRKANGH